MAVTVNVDLSWDGKMSEAVAKASDKNLKNTLKDMTGAVDVRINDKKVWENEGTSYDKADKLEKSNKKKKKEHKINENDYYYE